MKTDSAIIAGVAIIAVVLGGFAIYQTVTLNQQLDLANNKINTLQSNYDNLLTRVNNLQTHLSAFEKLEIINMNSSSFSPSTNSWNVTLTVNNTGYSDATIDYISLNGILYVSPVNTPIPLNISAGAQQELWLILTYPIFDPGEFIVITLHTESSSIYSGTVVLSETIA